MSCRGTNSVTKRKESIVRDKYEEVGLIQVIDHSNFFTTATALDQL